MDNIIEALFEQTLDYERKDENVTITGLDKLSVTTKYNAFIGFIRCNRLDNDYYNWKQRNEYERLKSIYGKKEREE